MENPVTFGGDTFFCYPTPKNIAKTTDSLFRACGLTLRKGEYLQGISQQLLSGTLDLDHFRTYAETESILSEMVEIRSVGRWTAELIILRGLHRADSFPADDGGVRRFISQFYRQGEKTSSIKDTGICGTLGSMEGFAAEQKGSC